MGFSTKLVWFLQTFRAVFCYFDVMHSLYNFALISYLPLHTFEVRRCMWASKRKMLQDGKCCTNSFSPLTCCGLNTQHQAPVVRIVCITLYPHDPLCRVELNFPWWRIEKRNINIIWVHIYMSSHSTWGIRRWFDKNIGCMILYPLRSILSLAPPSPALPFSHSHTTSSFTLGLYTLLNPYIVIGIETMCWMVEVQILGLLSLTSILLSGSGSNSGGEVDTWVSSGRGRSLCDSGWVADICTLSPALHPHSLQLVSESTPSPSSHPHSSSSSPSLSPCPHILTLSPSTHCYTHSPSSLCYIYTHTHMSHLHSLPIPTLSWLQLGGFLVKHKCISVESRDYCNTGP